MIIEGKEVKRVKILTTGYIRQLLQGTLTQGSDEMIIKHGAYRLKQVRHQHTILFVKRKIVNWDTLKPYFPIVIVSDKPIELKTDMQNVTIIKVDDLDASYWRFIHAYRAMIDIPVIAVTGTSGKTTTKEIIYHLLSEKLNVAHTNSTNNSRTEHLKHLLSMGPETEVAVFETAVGAPGDLTNASAYLKPTIGIITNIGEHHLNYCKTIEGYIAAKGELCKALEPNGTLIVNADDKNIRTLDLKNFTGKLITFGLHARSDFQARDISFSSNGMFMTVIHLNKQYKMYVPGLGEHQVYNALAAIAAVNCIGIKISSLTERLKTFEPMNKQIQVVEGINNSIIIDDTWSITTTSLAAALKVLKAVGTSKKKIAVIGTITDLGSWGYIIHEHAGKILAKSEIDVLITIGEHARIMADYVEMCNTVSEVYACTNHHRAYELLKILTNKNTITLIKGDMYSDSIKELAKLARKKNNDDQ
ncbi:UDP-N-acetylmuramoyl-tripeptide--D-alanyl-D-alanine ligase [Sporosarcina sp. Sa2YVA2]|uniref:UDP-N-acetylmuramoyl-tripeptide--D-alanyl-D-alanine ligase n=1 Tax=Sporosarcina quadrami TaxID=2762234 RepID=A0ABR8UD32_9BACL|nr:UDP-N-acetylmuramoyl-tripeptide--D-alanyl-D-alanine ligase [Sporosarcina quadrami]